MRYGALDNVRRALFGFEYDSKNYRGWFDVLFEDYTLHPYLNLFKSEAQDLLYKKSLFGRLAPIFAKRLRITSIVNQLIGVDLPMSRDRGRTFVEEIAEVLLEEQESRKTVESRVVVVDNKLEKGGRRFASLNEQVHRRESLPTVAKKT